MKPRVYICPTCFLSWAWPDNIARVCPKCMGELTDITPRRGVIVTKDFQKRMDWDEWEEKLDIFWEEAEPVKKPESEVYDLYSGYIWDDFDRALELKVERPYLYVYTLVEDDEGAQWIVQGMTYVNRVGYIFTQNHVGLAGPLRFLEADE